MVLSPTKTMHSTSEDKPHLMQTTIPMFKKARTESPQNHPDGKKVISYPKPPAGDDWHVCRQFVSDWKNWACNSHSTPDATAYDRMGKQLQRFRPDGVKPSEDDIVLYEGDFNRVPYPALAPEWKRSVLNDFVASWINWGWSARRNKDVRAYERMQGHLSRHLPTPGGAQEPALSDSVDKLQASKPVAPISDPMPEGAAVEVATA